MSFENTDEPQGFFATMNLRWVIAWKSIFKDCYGFIFIAIRIDSGWKCIPHIRRWFIRCYHICKKISWYSSTMSLRDRSLTAAHSLKKFWVADSSTGYFQI